MIDRAQAELLIAGRLSEKRPSTRGAWRPRPPSWPALRRRARSGRGRRPAARLLPGLTEAETLAAAARTASRWGRSRRGAPEQPARPRSRGGALGGRPRRRHRRRDRPSHPGGPGMTVLEKCLYLADFCEPGREFSGVDEVRVLAGASLDAAVGAAAGSACSTSSAAGAGWCPMRWRCTTRLMPATRRVQGRSSAPPPSHQGGALAGLGTLRPRRRRGLRAPYSVPGNWGRAGCRSRRNRRRAAT